MSLLRYVMLSVSRNENIKKMIMAIPVTRDVVKRFVPGETAEEALDAVHEIKAKGMHVSIDVLGEDTLDLAMASDVTQQYLHLLSRLKSEGLADVAEVSVKLSAVGQFLGSDGEQIALENARTICKAAEAAGVTGVNFDMEDHTTVDSTLSIVAKLREEFPHTACVIQAYLFRSESDIEKLAQIDGQRVRLCKGAYDEPAEVAFKDRGEVDRSYVRCMKLLMAGKGYPMIASHDPRIVAIAEDLAQRNGRNENQYEFQMLYGVRPVEQERLAAAGHKVRVYVPYGTDWYGYFTRRLAERPANVVFFLRSFLGKS